MEKLERARELTGVSIYVSALVKDQIRMAESAEIPETAKAALNNAASLLDQLILMAEEVKLELECGLFKADPTAG